MRGFITVVNDPPLQRLQGLGSGACVSDSFSSFRDVSLFDDIRASLSQGGRRVTHSQRTPSLSPVKGCRVWMKAAGFRQG